MKNLLSLSCLCTLVALFGCGSNSPEAIVEKAIANRQSFDKVVCEFEIKAGLVKNAADEEAGRLSETLGVAKGYYAKRGDQEIIVIKENSIPETVKSPDKTAFMRAFLRTSQVEFNIYSSGTSASINRIPPAKIGCEFDPWYLSAWHRAGLIEESAKTIIAKDSKAEPQVKKSGQELQIEIKTQGQLVFTFDPTKNYLPVAFGTIRGTKTGLRVLEATQNGGNWFPKTKFDVATVDEFGDGKPGYRWEATKTEFREPTDDEMKVTLTEPCSVTLAMEVKSGVTLPAGETITPKSLLDIATKARP